MTIAALVEDGVAVASRGALGWLGGVWVWLAVIAVVAATAFGAGYWQATSMAEDKLVAAQAEMYAKGVTAQRKFDDNNAKRAKADYDKRHAADLMRNDVLAAALALTPVLVPKVEACTISVDAMKQLNEVIK